MADTLHHVPCCQEHSFTVDDKRCAPQPAKLSCSSARLRQANRNDVILEQTFAHRFLHVPLSRLAALRRRLLLEPDRSFVGSIGHKPGHAKGGDAVGIAAAAESESGTSTRLTGRYQLPGTHASVSLAHQIVRLFPLRERFGAGSLPIPTLAVWVSIAGDVETLG